MDGKYVVNAFGLAVFALVYFGIMLLAPPKSRLLYFMSAFGFLALLTVILVLSAPLLLRLRNNAVTRFLVVQRRWIGIYAFLFAAAHVALVFNYLFAWDFGSILSDKRSLFLLMGALAFAILVALAATSNDHSMRALGAWWKKLHRLLYLALAVVIVHAFNVGLVIFKSQLLQAAVVIAVLAAAALKFNVVKL